MAQYPTRKESTDARHAAKNARALARFARKNANATDGAVKSLSQGLTR